MPDDLPFFKDEIQLKEDGLIDPYYKLEVIPGWDVINEPIDLELQHIHRPKRKDDTENFKEL